MSPHLVRGKIIQRQLVLAFGCESMYSMWVLTLSHMAYLEVLNPWHVGRFAQQNRRH
jgi:hypothetical protein